MAGDWLVGALTELGSQAKERRKRREDEQSETRRADRKAILEGLMAGSIEQAPQGQGDIFAEAIQPRRPQSVKEALSMGLFGAQPTEKVGYRRTSGGNVEQQLKQAQLSKAQAEAEQIKSFSAGGTTAPEGYRLKTMDVGAGKYERISDSETMLTPSLRKQKIKDTSELVNTASRNANIKQYVQEAIDAVDKIPQGAGGLFRRKGMEWFDPQNPILGEWQKIKSVLSDIQLGKLQFTKGAISDREMNFFANAVANNDIASAPRIKLILGRALNELDTDEEAKKKAYALNYGEDPEEMFGQGQVIEEEQQKAGLQQLDENTAMQLLQEAGGDKNKARAIAKQRGYSF